MNASKNLNKIQSHTLINYQTYKGVQYEKLDTSFQVFGQPLNTAPVVLVNHALTGNSDIASHEKGWWKEIVGDGKLIDTLKYTVLAFNIPGNGYDGLLIKSYKDFIAKDIARIFYLVLKALKINQVHAIIGGSLGGAIAWEMAVLYPNFSKYIIPIAADWKTTDWIIGHNSIQESILLNSKKPIQDARKMAMLFYRTPASLTKRFNRTIKEDSDIFNVASWLTHHGKKLEDRFTIQAYLLMNHLLTTINICKENESVSDVLETLQSKIIQIAVDSDLFFVKAENLKTKELLDACNISNEYHEINSVDGHDAFLIEHEQISKFLKPIFDE